MGGLACAGGAVPLQPGLCGGRRAITVPTAISNPIMQSLRNRIIWLEHGEIRRIGSFDEIYPSYIAAAQS